MACRYLCMGVDLCFDLSWRKGHAVDDKRQQSSGYCNLHCVTLICGYRVSLGLWAFAASVVYCENHSEHAPGFFATRLCWHKLDCNFMRHMTGNGFILPLTCWVVIEGTKSPLKTCGSFNTGESASIKGSFESV